MSAFVNGYIQAFLWPFLGCTEQIYYIDAPLQSLAALSRYTFSGGSRSLDQKRSSVTPSTSLNSISETKQRTDSDAEILPEPERSLRSLKGPEHWSKGERHAIIPILLKTAKV